MFLASVQAAPWKSHTNFPQKKKSWYDTCLNFPVLYAPITDFVCNPKTRVGWSPWSHVLFLYFTKWLKVRICLSFGQELDCWISVMFLMILYCDSLYFISKVLPPQERVIALRPRAVQAQMWLVHTHTRAYPMHAWFMFKPLVCSFLLSPKSER